MLQNSILEITLTTNKQRCLLFFEYREIKIVKKGIVIKSETLVTHP